MSALSVALHRPMPIAPGTSIATKTGSECVSALPPQPIAANSSPIASVRLSPSALDDRADQHALHEDAEEAERAEQVAGVRRVEAESPRAEQRERRLVDRERRPVDEVDREEHAQVRRGGRALASARHGDAPPACARCTVSGSHTHASTVATTVMAAAAQIGAV